MENISEERMKKLIEIADKARLGIDWQTLSILVICILVALDLIILVFNPAGFGLEQWQVLVEFSGIPIAIVALIIAAFSFSKGTFEAQIIDLAEKEFQRLSKNVEENEKILLKALITMKIKQPNVSLTELYDLYPSMFDEETIVKRMYG